jgi:hypothetical protein
MRPKLISLDSPDLPKDPMRPGLIGLEDYDPPDPHSFHLRIDAEIGSDEGEGADLFSFVVSAPDSLTHRSIGRGPESHAWDRRVLFLREWSYERLLRIVNDVLSRAEGSNWAAVAAQLSPYMEWEFEDYQS